IALSSPAPGQPLSVQEDQPGSVSFTIGDPDVGTAPANLTLSFSTDNATLLPDGSVTFNTNNTPSIIATVTPGANQFGTNRLTLIVSRSDGASAGADLQFRVQTVNDQPVLSRLTTKTTTEGEASVFPVLVTDVDTV